MKKLIPIFCCIIFLSSARAQDAIATDKSAQADIPDLLSANTPETLRAILRKHLQDDYRVSAFLITALQQYLITPPSGGYMRDDKFRLVILLANASHDSQVTRALADLMIKTSGAPDQANPRLAELLVLSGEENNEKIYGLYPQIVLNLLNQPNSSSQIHIFLIEHVLSKPPEAIRTNSTIVSAASTYLKLPFSPPPNFTSENTQEFELKTTLAKAYFGDPDAFGAYLNSTPTAPYQRALQNKFLATILYSGPSDKLAILKANYSKAIYNNGVWSLTMPGFAPAQNTNPSQSQLTTDANAVANTQPPTGTQVAQVDATASPTSSSPGNTSVVVAVNPPPQPVECTIIKSVPLESYSAGGDMTGVTQSVVGRAYKCIRVEGTKAVLEDAVGTVYKIDASAVSQLPK